MMPCPCCSGKSYAECCQPYHLGTFAPNPEALMRSRYSAYALGLIDYIIETTHPESIHFEKNRAQWKRSLELFANTTRFIRLEIHAVGEDWVDFTAHLEQQNKPVLHKEKSRFRKNQGRWLYLEHMA